MNRKLTTLAVTALLIVGLAFAAPAVASLSQEITVDHPDDQKAFVQASLSGDVTDYPITLENDGTVVNSATISGTVDDTVNKELAFTSLAEGTYHLNSSGNTNVTIDHTGISVRKADAFNVSKNETVTADVAFDSDTAAQANVTFYQSTSQNSTTLNFDPVAATDGTDTLTASYTAQETGNVTVLLTTYNETAYDGLWLEAGGTGLFGTSGGSSTLTMYAVGGLFLAIAIAYFREMEDDY